MLHNTLNLMFVDPIVSQAIDWSRATLPPLVLNARNFSGRTPNTSPSCSRTNNVMRKSHAQLRSRAIINNSDGNDLQTTCEVYALTQLLHEATSRTGPTTLTANWRKSQNK